MSDGCQIRVFVEARACVSFCWGGGRTLSSAVALSVQRGASERDTHIGGSIMGARRSQFLQVTRICDDNSATGLQLREGG